MLDINTNNYIESWHNILKTGYLGGARKQRTDSLIHILLREALPDFRLKVARVSVGLDRRRLNQSEKNQLHMSSSLDAELAQSKICPGEDSQGGYKNLEFFFVESFTNEETKYVVSLDAASIICKCTCHHMISSKSVCKHMFLVQRVYGYSISFNTRIGSNAEIKESLVSNPTTQQPANENKERQEAINRRVQVSIEQIRSVISCVGNGVDASEEQVEALAAWAEQAPNVKRVWESSDNHWSKRQRR